MAAPDDHKDRVTGEHSRNAAVAPLRSEESPQGESGWKQKEDGWMALHFGWIYLGGGAFMKRRRIHH